MSHYQNRSNDTNAIISLIYLKTITIKVKFTLVLKQFVVEVTSGGASVRVQIWDVFLSMFDRQTLSVLPVWTKDQSKNCPHHQHPASCKLCSPAKCTDYWFICTILFISSLISK